MHFAQHWILSWFIGEGGGVASRGQRRLITVAGLLPDADVIPYVVAAGWNWLGKGAGFREAWQSAFDQVHTRVHHHYTHGILFVLLTGVGAGLLARWSGRDAPEARASGLKVGALALLASLLHSLADVIASGPTWPIYPWWPWSEASLGVAWSWTLADWPNLLILALMLLAARQYAVATGRSPVEVLSLRADAWLVGVFRGENRHRD